MELYNLLLDGIVHCEISKG